MVQIQITITDAQLQSGLENLTAKLANLKPAMADIGESALRKVRKRFDNEIAPDGSKWNALSEATIKAKARRKRTGKPYRTNAEPSAILKDTFTLRDSIAYQASNSSVAIGTNIFYGTFNQNTRPFLGVDDDDMVEIVDIIRDYLER
jgi:phage virion morphogenesis protein